MVSAETPHGVGVSATAATEPSSVGRVGWRSVIVDVRFLAVLGFLLVLAVVVAVGQRVVVVLVGVPVGAVLPLVERVIGVVVGDVVVIVAVGTRRVGVLGLLALPLGALGRGL